MLFERFDAKLYPKLIPVIMNNEEYVKINSLIYRLWQHLERGRKKQFLKILILTILNAFAELVSLGALIPFLGVLVSPEKIFKQPGVEDWANVFGFQTPESIVIPLTLLFIGATILAGLLRIAHLRATIKVTFGCGADLSGKLYKTILSQNYAQHLKFSSASIISGMAKIDVAVNSLSQVVRLISSSLLIISIVAALIYASPIIAITSFTFFGIAYALINLSAKTKVKNNSAVIAKNKTKIVKILQDGLGGVRDIILDKTQGIFLRLYKDADKELREAEGSNSMIEGSPRFLMEAVGMVFVAMLAYMLSVRDGGMQSNLPILGMLALSAQRMLPALQQAYNALTAIKGHHSSLVEVIGLLDLPYEMDDSVGREKLQFKNNIQLIDVSFHYSHPDILALKKIDLKINKGERIGIIGTTGSGKSTLIDILMGLLVPTSGKICVDGMEMTAEFISSWRRNVAHVPQSIFLTDGSVTDNIAFGVQKDEINEARIREAARCACITEFVERMPDGYNSLIGERGVMLSGGERQRLGIARALYKESEIIILDEATSALDMKTEKKVMDSIEALPARKTLVMVAHRLSTIVNCDKIYVMNKGEIVDFGTYQEVSNRGIYTKAEEDMEQLSERDTND